MSVCSRVVCTGIMMGAPQLPLSIIRSVPPLPPTALSCREPSCCHLDRSCINDIRGAVSAVNHGIGNFCLPATASTLSVHLPSPEDHIPQIM